MDSAFEGAVSSSAGCEQCERDGGVGLRLRFPLIISLAVLAVGVSGWRGNRRRGETSQVVERRPWSAPDNVVPVRPTVIPQPQRRQWNEGRTNDQVALQG